MVDMQPERTVEIEVGEDAAAREYFKIGLEGNIERTYDSSMS